jgi:hypothetical protein
MPRLRCPHCTKILHLKGDASGKAVACPACKGRFRVPNLTPAAPPSGGVRAPAPVQPAAVSSASAADDDVEIVPEDDDVEIVPDDEPILDALPGEAPPPGQERPRRPRPRRRRRRDAADEGFSLIDNIPMSYQAQIGVSLLLILIFGIPGFIYVRSPIGAPLIAAAFFSSVWGCAAQCRTRGAPEWLGLLGILGPLGGLILMICLRSYESR